MRKLTQQQKQNLVGAKFTSDSYFNPVIAINDVWFISEEEVEQCINPEFMWVKDLPVENYVPKPNPLNI